MVKYSSYSRTIPTVNFDSKELELLMMDFMMKNFEGKKSINEYMRLVMLRLGFNLEDKIRLCNFDRNSKKDQYFKCIVNDNRYYEIKFENVDNNLNTRISLVDYNKEITYECIPLSLSELGVRIIPVKEKVMYADGVTYVRELDRDKAKFEVIFEDYKFVLEVVRPKELELPMYDNNGKYSRYRLDNEELLKNYLVDFFPILTNGDIVSVYKKVCEISLGSGVSKYPDLSLSFSFCDKVTDLIHLKNGELERFGVTLLKMGRTIFLNKDGSWSYEIYDKEDLFKIIMNVDDDKTNYDISIKNGCDIDLISEIIQSDTYTVKENIVNVRKLVNKTFDRKDSN